MTLEKVREQDMKKDDAFKSKGTRLVTVTLAKVKPS